MPADLAQRRVAGVQGAGPAVGRPAGRLVEAGGDPVGLQQPHLQPRGARRPRPGRRRPPAAGCRGRGAPSAARPAASRARSSGPAGSGCSPAVSSARPERGEADHRLPLEATSTPCPGVGGAVTAACQAAVAAAVVPVVEDRRRQHRRYAVRQVTTWTRAISGGVLRGAPGAPRRPPSRQPGNEACGVHPGSVGARPGDRTRVGRLSYPPGRIGRRERHPTSSGCRPRWPGASRWPRRASPSRARRGRSARRQLRRLTERLAVVQIDSVNVLSRSHYLPAFSRLGAYPRPALDDAGRPAARSCSSTGRTRRRCLPVRLQPFLRWRMAAAEQHAWGNMVRARSGSGRATSPRSSTGSGPRARSRPASWPSPTRTGPARCGTGTPARSRSSGCSSPARSPPARARAGFERVYDLTERVLPRRGRSPRRRPTAADAVRELVRTAARALGVATETRPARLLPAAARPTPGRRSPSWPSRRAAAGRGRRLGPPGLAGPGGAGGPAGSGPGRCSARSTRWSGSGPGSSGSSASATGWRSTPRRPSGCTATTCCRSCSATSWSRGSTSRPTGRPACCGCRRRTPRRGSTGPWSPTRSAGAAAHGRLAGAGRRRRRRPGRPRGVLERPGGAAVA